MDSQAKHTRAAEMLNEFLHCAWSVAGSRAEAIETAIVYARMPCTRTMLCLFGKKGDVDCLKEFERIAEAMKEAQGKEN